MTDHNFVRPSNFVDQYGNQHQLVSELARGGQGVVYRTTDPDLAIKQPLDADGAVSQTADLKKKFENIRFLPIPKNIPISFPLAVLRDEAGYVMRLLSEMEKFGAFDMSGTQKALLEREPVPQWLRNMVDKTSMLTLMHYANTGSTKRRLKALSKCASILARLHARGLVYGDISPNNCFMSQKDSRDVWLIDADNLRFEVEKGGSAVYTPRFGAPEVVQGRDRSRPQTDAWAFAVMAFETLTQVHPFIGQRVLLADEGQGGWDVEPSENTNGEDLDEKAYGGLLPFIDDENDNSNQGINGLPRNLVLNTQLAKLFQETLGSGRKEPWTRPGMIYWALELARAHDHSVLCPECLMSYFLDYIQCPYCEATRPSFAIAKTDHWQISLQATSDGIELPHRLFNAFSLEMNDVAQYQIVLDLEKKFVGNAFGTKLLPNGLSFHFFEEGE